jgi:NADH-quinone oxidoreductase subunit L
MPMLPNIFRIILYPLYNLSYNKYYVDELYDIIFVRPTFLVGKFLWKIFDSMIIDGLGPNGFASISDRLGAALNRAQTGYLYHYAFVMLLALVGFISWYVL